MVFGAGEFERLGELAKDHGNKPLVVFGQNSARDTGLLDRAIENLQEAGLDPVVFEGIEPNPRLDTLQEGSRKAADNNCDMVIGIGGGSVMDASKIIAFGSFDPDNIWKHVATWEDDYEPVKEALPIVVVSTLAATGSEGNGGAVVTNMETKDKVGVFSSYMYPKVSIIDPELTVATPLDYTRDGVVDMAIHVLESYFNGSDADFSDRVTESLCIEVMLAFDTLVENPEDIDARGTLSYLAAIALTGFINRPRGGDFPLHILQHPLSGHFDISHGRGLALLLPRWLKFVKSEKPGKIIQFGERVFAMDLETYHPLEAADRVIDRITEWLEDIGAWLFMDDLGIPNDPVLFREIAEQVIKTYGRDDGIIGGIKPLKVDDIVEIYNMCVRTGTEEFTPEPEPETEAGSEDEDGAEPEGTEPEEIIENVEGEEIPEGAKGDKNIIIEEVVEEEVTEE